MEEDFQISQQVLLIEDIIFSTTGGLMHFKKIQLELLVFLLSPCI